MSDERKRYEACLSNVAEPDLLEELKAMGSDESAVVEAFHKDLEFGTAGLRGIIGAGSDRMNVHTVGRATQGFADYLVANFDEPSVAIGRDSRNKGDEFVKRAAEVFAANGVRVHVYPRIEPTPAVSWAVRDLACAGGVCMTASHNPAEYNGYKAYGPDGCQIASEAADEISACIARVDMFDGVKRMPFDDALAQGLVNWIGEDVLERYLDAVEACSAADPEDREVDLKLVYTPLNGTGMECVSQILERIGLTDFAVVEEQRNPDGNFPTCPYPNPETREALERGIALAEELQPDLLLATDPDADRMGAAVRDGQELTLLSGNEIGVLLLDYLARQAKAHGHDMASKVAVTTIVSSVMVDALAREYGFEVRRVLTGFKYIGGVIAELEQAGETNRFLFGFEESYGYLNGSHVRDKDAVDAVMLMCEMARQYKRRGIGLAEAMDELYQRLGHYLNKTLSFSYPGVDGANKMAEIMAGLRSSAPSTVGPLGVTEVIDYATGVGKLPAAEVLEFRLEGDNKLIVRPSGTEPKIKAYLFAKGDTREAASQLLSEMETAANALMS